MSDSRTTQPETEIEVTPEMIDAGVEELWQYNPTAEADSSRVLLIYRAMRLLERRRSDGR